MKLSWQVRFDTQADDFASAHAKNTMLNKYFKPLIINTHKK
jgi:hypothetical protein